MVHFVFDHRDVLYAVCLTPLTAGAVVAHLGDGAYYLTSLDTPNEAQEAAIAEFKKQL